MYSRGAMPQPATPTCRFIDSHTAGEPTRVLVEGGPDLGRGSMAERRARFAAEHDRWRRALATEPRGHDVIVGALLCEPVDPACAAGVIFFNNAGVIGMCGHGTIGLVATLAWLGRISPGEHRIETPVGEVRATLHGDGSVTVANVPVYRHAAAVPVQLPDGTRFTGDVAWGGNWFYLCADHGLPIDREHVPQLSARAQAIREALGPQGITGADGAEIDHIELIGPARNGANAGARAGRNYVHCPGAAYDRSPCGTGTSAKLACLAADGKLAPGERWVQESVIGSEFRAHYERRAEDGPGRIRPFIHGRAFVNLDARAVFEPEDPFAWGLG
jgi:4-hydroxyproline epimerase